MPRKCPDGRWEIWMWSSTDRAAYVALGNNLLHSEAVDVQEITQEGQKNTKDKLLEKLNI